MRKLGCLALATVLLGATVLGCGRGGEGKIIALVPKAMDSEFWLAVGAGAREAAESRGDVTLSIVAPDREINIDQQVSILEDQLRRGVRVLIVAPTGSAQVVPVLEQAASRKIPVILVDTDAPFTGKVSYIGTDNRAGGARRPGHRQHHRTGTVALIHGVPGNQSQGRPSGRLRSGAGQTPAFSS
jgi:ribose transport system substrate-binding protein